MTKNISKSSTIDKMIILDNLLAQEFIQIVSAYFSSEGELVNVHHIEKDEIGITWNYNRIKSPCYKIRYQLLGEHSAMIEPPGTRYIYPHDDDIWSVVDGFYKKTIREIKINLISGTNS